MSAARGLRSLVIGIARAAGARRGGRRPPAAATIGRGRDAITVEYEPRLDGDADPGEVVWAWVPFEEDPAQGKDRPVVVVGRRHGRLACVALTSRRHDRQHQVLVGTGAWDRERRPSWAKLDRVVDVDAGAVRREGAVLDRERFRALVDALRGELDR